MIGTLHGLLAASAWGQSELLLSTAEQSNWKRTGRYEEAVRLCQEAAKRDAARARCFSFGETPEGRPMMALAVSGDGTLTPAAAKAKGRPVVIFQGGIHAGEIDGKDAGFAFLKETLSGVAEPLDASEEVEDLHKRSERILKDAVLVFVPVFNIDGHERFGRWNRPNQVGPEEMGWRVTSGGLNLNRDYTKAASPEMTAMLGLLQDWDPILYIDLHVTDGAEFQPDIAVMTGPAEGGPRPLANAALSLRGATMKFLKAHGHKPTDFYPSFVVDDDPATGFERGFSPPRFSQSYWAIRNRIGVLVETHSWKDYRWRCRATLNALRILTLEAARQGKSWMKTAAEADQDAARLAGKSVVLTWDHGPKSRVLDFPGYAYDREPSPISGRLETRYHPDKPEIWHVPLFEDVEPALRITAPRGGYLVEAGYATMVAERLTRHGIHFDRLKSPLGATGLETWRATESTFEKESYEGRQRLKAKGKWTAEKRTLGPGALFVPIRTKDAALVMHLLEPDAPDSLLGWGYFNSAFEMREYMEPYVADQYGRELLAKNPEVRAEFHRKLEKEPEFAKNPEARLEFFYRHHTSWDERYRLYPVYRTEKSPL